MIALGKSIDLPCKDRYRLLCSAQEQSNTVDFRKDTEQESTVLCH